MPKTIKGKEKLNKEKEKFQKHHIKKKEDTFDNKILAYGLDNAILHEGRCQEGAIIGKLFQEGLKKEELPKGAPGRRTETAVSKAPSPPPHAFPKYIAKEKIPKITQ